MNTIQAKGTALITGASTGIGAIYADRLAKRGHDLILVARNKERLASLARRLANDTGRKVETVEADLTSPADLQRVEDILRTNAGISLLVNNAGVGATAPLLASDVDKMDDMIRLNVTALTRLTYAAAPGFVARGNGTIINISSVVAIAPETDERRLWRHESLRARAQLTLSFTSSPTRASACRRCCREPRPPSSGTWPACRFTSFRRRT